jgi:hypothetical protein
MDAIVKQIRSLSPNQHAPTVRLGHLKVITLPPFP